MHSIKLLVRGLTTCAVVTRTICDKCVSLNVELVGVSLCRDGFTFDFDDFLYVLVGLFQYTRLVVHLRAYFRFNIYSYFSLSNTYNNLGSPSAFLYISTALPKLYVLEIPLAHQGQDLKL